MIPTISPEARRWWDIAVKDGSLPREELKADDGRAELLELGVLRVSVDDATVWVPVDPDAVAARRAAQAQREAAAMLTRSAELPRAYRQLADVYRAVQGEPGGGPIRHVRLKEAISEEVAAIVATAHRRLLTQQPDGPRPASVLASVIAQDMALADRAVEGARTMYHPSARSDPATLEYVRQMREHGAQFRTEGAFIDRLIIVDDVAIYPMMSDNNRAVICRDPATVHMLVCAFDRDWERGIPLSGELSDPPADEVGRIRAELVRMKIMGLSAKQACSRLGLGYRTVNRYWAQILTDYGAQSDAQLAWMLRDRSPDGNVPLSL